MCEPQRKVLIRAYRGTGPLCWSIRWQTRSKYAHLAIQYGDQIFEAVPWLGVIQRDVAESDQVADVRSVEVPEHVYQRMLDWAIAHKGDRYEWPALARFVSRRRWQRNDRWFCSEFGYANFVEGGIYLLAETEEWEVSPGLFMRSPLLTRESD